MLKAMQQNKQLLCKALVGALASMDTMERLCGRDFTEHVKHDVETLSVDDRLSFWNLINVRMNPNTETHLRYGTMFHHPLLQALVARVCYEMKLIQNNNR